MADKCVIPTQKKGPGKSAIIGPMVRFRTVDILDNKVTQACPITSGVVTYSYAQGAPRSEVIINKGNLSLFHMNFLDSTDTQGHHTNVNMKFYNSGGGIIHQADYPLFFTSIPGPIKFIPQYLILGVKVPFSGAMTYYSPHQYLMSDIYC